MRRAGRFIRRLGAVVVIVVLAVLAVFVVGMRQKSPAVLDAVRRMNREVFNPRQMDSAGTPGAFASVIEHLGRSSGTAYRTPVTAVPTHDGFVVALPYGSRADWLQNVLARGSATIVHEGESHPVDRPEVTPIEAVDDVFSPADQKAHRLMGVDRALQVRRADTH